MLLNAYFRAAIAQQTDNSRPICSTSDKQKEHPPPPEAVVAFFVILAPDTKLSTYLLTYLLTYLQDCHNFHNLPLSEICALRVLSFLLLLLLFYLLACYIEVIAMENEATTSTTRLAVGDILSTTSSHRLPVVSLNFAGNNELPVPDTTTRHVSDNTLKYSRTTSHGKSRASFSRCQLQSTVMCCL